MLEGRAVEPARRVVLFLLPLLVAWKLTLFRQGVHLHVRWIMSPLERAACTAQDVLAWGLVAVAAALALRRWGRRALVPVVAACNVVLFLHLADVRCKQVLYQPFGWETLAEAAREAGVARSSLGLFFGPGFTLMALASFAFLNLPLVWRGQARPGRDLLPAASALVLLLAPSVVLLGRPKPYHLDANVLTGWAVDGLRRPPERATGRFDQAARILGASDLSHLRPGASPLASGKNVVLFVAESLGWTASSLGESALETTPFLRALAQGALIVAPSRVQVASSTKSIFTLLTGRYANPHLELLESTAVRHDSLARTLRDAGYFTAFVTSQHLGFQNSGRQYRAMGFDRLIGAEELIARARRAGRSPRLSGSWGVDDRELAGAVEALLPAGRPFFLVVYNVASHHPYEYPGFPPDADDYRRYLAALRYGDDALAVVANTVRARGHADDTVFIMTGDHGENVTPGRYTVRGCLLAEIEHLVPLVVALPVPASAPLTVAGARHLDVAPTILDLLGIAPRVPMQGRSLLAGGAPPAAYINSYGRCEVTGVVEGGKKVVHDRRLGRAWTVDLSSENADDQALPLDPATTRVLADRLAAFATYNESELRKRVAR